MVLLLDFADRNSKGVAISGARRGGDVSKNRLVWAP